MSCSYLHRRTIAGHVVIDLFVGYNFNRSQLVPHTDCTQKVLRNFASYGNAVAGAADRSIADNLKEYGKPLGTPSITEKRWSVASSPRSWGHQELPFWGVESGGG
jgi:hypothetical protein